MTPKQPENSIFTCGPCSLRITGGLIMFTVLLGTTDIGFIPVPTAAKYATTMHLPTILASLTQGWPIGMIVGSVFGMTSMYSTTSPIAEDPVIALTPRLLVGLTPFLTYQLMKNFNEYLRLGAGAVVGTMTNTVLFLGLAVVRGFLGVGDATRIGIVHGVPEAIVAVAITIPGVFFIRRFTSFLKSEG